MADLKRSGSGHIDFDQTFTGIKAVRGNPISIKLAGPSAGGHGDIRFAFKHILDKSRKHADDDTKLKNRVWHRVDKGGQRANNPTPGAKAGGLSRGKKYASALKYNDDMGKMANTAIYLSLMDLDSLLKEMANAIVYHNWGDSSQAKVDFEFSKPCIKTANASGHITGPVSNMTVEVYKTGPTAYEMGHLKSTS